MATPIPALINTTLTQTKIDAEVAKHVLNFYDHEPVTYIPREMDIPFNMGDKTLILRCQVVEFEEEDIHIHLGWDFLSQQHLRLKCRDVTLFGHWRWPTSTPDTVQFAYNAPWGQHLRRNLDRLGYPMLPDYSRPQLPPNNQRRQYFSKFRDGRRK